MIDARLHPADVIAHDEEDVWFLPLLLCGGGNAGYRGGGTQHDKSAPDCSEPAHCDSLLDAGCRAEAAAFACSTRRVHAVDVCIIKQSLGRLCLH